MAAHGFKNLMPLSEERIETLADFALALAQAGGAAALAHFRKRELAVTNKGAGDTGQPYDPVTAADREAEEVMRRMIAARFPDHGVRGEEMADTKGEAAFEWVLDPIDGTRAFVTGLPTWMTLVALLHEGRVVLGVCHQPFVGESFLGTGSAAWRIDRDGARDALQVSAVTDLARARAGTTLPDIYRSDVQKRFIHGVRSHVRELRYDADAYFYCMVAAGHMELAFDTEMHIFDTAALIPIVRGAGGVFCGWDGVPDALEGDVIAAANEALLDQALKAAGLR